MSLRIKKYIEELRQKSFEYECKDINGEEAKTFISQNQRRIVCFVPSIIMLLLLKNGFSETFVSYMSNSLSILIGLFSTTIIFAFDKFYQKTDLSKASSIDKLIDIQSYNYTKQFIYTTGYSIILSVFTLILLAFCSLFEDATSICVWDYDLSIDNINMKTICNFILVSLVLFQRYLILYYIANILYNTLFAVSSMVKFMTLKNDR